jgi:hypothetical protein
MKLIARIKEAKEFIKQLEPIGFDEYKKLFKFSDNDYIEILTWKERDIRKHKKYFALMNCTLNHLPESTYLSDINTLRKSVQICIGNCEIAFDMEGNKQLQALSISFKGMDQVAFDELYTKSLNHISKVLLSHISYEDFTRDILNFY